MTSRIATAWAAYLEREGPFTSSSLEEPAAQVAAKRAFFAGAEAYAFAVLDCLMAGGAKRHPPETEARWTGLNAELADFARQRAEGTQ